MTVASTLGVSGRDNPRELLVAQAVYHKVDCLLLQYE